MPDSRTSKEYADRFDYSFDSNGHINGLVGPDAEPMTLPDGTVVETRRAAIGDGGVVLWREHCRAVDNLTAEIERLTRELSKERRRLDLAGFLVDPPPPAAQASKEKAVQLRDLRVRLKSGEYSGTDIMQAWIVIGEYADAIERTADEPSTLPSAWIRGHTMHTDAGIEYDEEVVPGSDKPPGDNWHPLYARPAQPPPAAHENLETGQRNNLETGRAPATKSELCPRGLPLRICPSCGKTARPYCDLPECGLADDKSGSAS